jgi:hypothetical protein
MGMLKMSNTHTLFTQGQNWMPSPAVVGAKYSSGSSSSWTAGARSISSGSWCLAVNKHGVFANLPRFLRARSKDPDQDSPGDLTG